MRIAVVLEVFPTPSERFIARELLALVGLGLDVRVFALARGHERLLADEPFRSLAERVTWLPHALSARAMAEKARVAVGRPGRLLRLVPAAVSSEMGDPRRLASLLPRLVWAPALARAAERSKAALIWAHFASLPGALGWMASRLAGLPFALSTHAWDIFVNRNLVAAQLEEAALVTTCSRAARDFLSSRYGEGAARAELAYHGLPAFADPAPRAPRTGRPFRVLAVGRLVPKKGFRHLVEAAALAPSGFELELAGDGPERQALAELSAERGVSGRVTMSGTLDSAGLVAAYARADIVAAPSVVNADGDRDGVPNSLLEAMAAGLPAVATDAGGLPEAVENGRTGLVVPQGDAGALAAAIARLEGDAALCARLSAGACSLLRERFSLEKNAAHLAGLLTRAAAGAAAAADAPGRAEQAP